MAGKLLLTRRWKLLLFNGSLVTFQERKHGLGPSYSAQTPWAASAPQNKLNHSCGQGFPSQTPSFRYTTHNSAAFSRYYTLRTSSEWMIMRCTDEDDTQITGQYYFSHLTSYVNYHRDKQTSKQTHWEQVHSWDNHAFCKGPPSWSGFIKRWFLSHRHISVLQTGHLNVGGEEH